MRFQFILSISVSYHTIPYHTIPYHTIPYHTIPYHTIPYHTIPCHAMPYHTIAKYVIIVTTFNCNYNRLYPLLHIYIIVSFLRLLYSAQQSSERFIPIFLVFSVLALLQNHPQHYHTETMENNHTKTRSLPVGKNALSIGSFLLRINGFFYEGQVFCGTLIIVSYVKMWTQFLKCLTEINSVLL